MRRRTKGEAIEQLPRDRLDEELSPLRRKAKRWASDHMTELRRARPVLPDSLHDRARDNWTALVAIGDLLGGAWPERARRAAQALSGTAETDTTAGVQLLADLQELFGKQGDRLTTDQILEALHARDDRPWPEWSRGKPLSSRQLAKLLKPFGISPGQFKRASEKCRGYIEPDFSDAFERYLGSNPVLPVPTHVFNNLDADPIRYPHHSGTGCEQDVSDCKQRVVPAVPDEDGGSAANTSSNEDMETFDL